VGGQVEGEDLALGGRPREFEIWNLKFGNWELEIHFCLALRVLRAAVKMAECGIWKLEIRIWNFEMENSGSVALDLSRMALALLDVSSRGLPLFWCDPTLPQKPS